MQFRNLVIFLLSGVLTGFASADATDSRICNMPNSTSRVCGMANAKLSAPRIVMYSNSSMTNTVRSYNLDPTTGTITQAFPDISTVIDPEDIGVYNNGLNLYLLGYSDNSILSYNINQNTGELSLLPNSRVNTVYKPYGLTITPNGKCGFVNGMQNDIISRYHIESSTGYLKQLSDFHTGEFGTPSGTKFTDDGRYLFLALAGSNSIATLTINQNSCDIESMVKVTRNICMGPSRLTIAKNMLYVSCSVENKIYLYSIDQSANLTYQNNIDSGGKETMALKILNNKYLYVTNRASNTIGIFEIESDGGLKLKDTLLVKGFGPRRISFDPTNNFAYIVNQLSSSIDIYKLGEDGFRLYYVSSVLYGREPYGLDFKVLD